MSLLHQIVCEIADREGVDPVALEPPLNDVVDIEALEALVSGSGSRQDDPYPVVAFEYAGYTVDIDGAENVSIGEHTDIPDEVSSPKSDSSLATISPETGHHERALKNVSDVLSSHGRPFGRRLDGLLEIVRKTLGMDSATLSYVNTDSYVFEAVDVAAPVELKAGETVPLADTVCKRVIETEQALVLGDVAVDAPDLVNSARRVSSYIGVPVFVDDEVYGTFCFHDSEPRDQAFSEWDVTFVELLSSWVSSELERRQRERASHATGMERSNAVE